MLNGELIIKVFEDSVMDWHKEEKESKNPYPESSMEYLLYSKNQIDTIQWHVEDEIRRPDLPDSDLVKFKRQIDSLNQKRTDLVERLDDYFLNLYKDVPKENNSRMNSETPAWLVDRMSILELKIYHMLEQTNRTDVTDEHKKNCQNKLSILLEQKKDMMICLNELLKDLETGKKYMKVYRQMKMYNDSNLNPSLYKNTK
jgi:hypothetical protein